MGARRSNSRRAKGTRGDSRRPGTPERLALGTARRVVAARPARVEDSGSRRPTSDLIIGRHPILEALRAGRRIHKLMVAEGAQAPGTAETTQLAVEKNVPVQRVTRERLDALSDHHQGMIAQAEPFQYVDFARLVDLAKAAPAERAPLLVAVDALQDPQNFGSLLRTASAAGATGVLMPERRAVGVTPVVGRASAGAIEHLMIAQVNNLVRALQELKQIGLWVIGLDAAGEQVYDQVDFTVPVVVVVGAEGSGLGRLVSETCDIRVRLPMLGPIDSLNAAVAGSIVLYEALRQRRALVL